ncbi:cysteine desulfurase/selenocysteine lyase [Constrictibacter sp. MBR-5]|jgi:cysteine desulfurase/selenocysteine lyase|uniref:cysteine desulfurase n=1 Tax=Constrictibacter sp. MBR-5 TaxID=3156467 RepID=UPI00339657FD
MTLSQPLAAARTDARPNFDVERVREDFPILARPVHGKRLAFLDSGASAQKPRQVIEAMRAAYEETYANVHRGVYFLSQRSTDLFEGAREKVGRFLNAPSHENIVFTRNTTEAINLVAASWGRTFLREGDEVIISALEHHANIVPWHLLKREKGIVLKIAPIDDDGNFLLDAFADLLTDRTRLVSITHISNAIGTIVPVAEVIRLAHARGVPVLVDGSQAAPHINVDVQALDADFYAFTGHKVYGPTGIGVLYGKSDLLASMPPYQGGGDMIETVTEQESTFKDPPFRFEAGTPAIVEAIGLGAAIDYVEALGWDNLHAHERDLSAYMAQRLGTVEGLTVVGNAREKAGITSFVMECAHPHDMGTILDRAGVAVRAGHHCAQPLMERYDVAATVRASLGLYNNRADVDQLVEGLQQVREIFG